MAAFLPIDPQYPLERIQYLLDDSQAVLLLHDAARSSLLEKLPNQATCSLAADYPPQDFTPQTEQLADELAYLLYTSGSTGRPKGVRISRANISNYLQRANRY